MSKPTDYERPAKRPLIDVSDNESTGNQPIEKSVRREEEVVPLSEEILASHHKAAKLEKDKQRAIQIAADLQSRVEFLESLIDKKRSDSDEEKKQVNELQKKVSDLSMQLETERSTANEAQTKDRARIDELTLKLSEATGREKRLAKKYQEKISSLTKELEEERSRANEDRMIDRARIEELTRKQAEATDSAKKLAKKCHEKIDEMTRVLSQQQSPKVPKKKAETTGSGPSTGAASAADVVGPGRKKTWLHVRRSAPTTDVSSIYDPSAPYPLGEY